MAFRVCIRSTPSFEREVLTCPYNFKERSGGKHTHVSLTPAGNPAGDLLDRLRGSSQGHTAFREATTICRKEERLSAQSGGLLLWGHKTSRTGCGPLLQIASSPAMRHQEGCFFKTQWRRQNLGSRHAECHNPITLALKRPRQEVRK